MSVFIKFVLNHWIRFKISLWTFWRIKVVVVCTVNGGKESSHISLKYLHLCFKDERNLIYIGAAEVFLSLRSEKYLNIFKKWISQAKL